MTPTILLVDDNAIQASVRRSVLLKAGRTVALATGAGKALEMLDDVALQESIGLVITDHQMPGMNGPEFVERLREKLPSVPVIVLSGYLDVEPEYEGLSVIFRTKPIAPEQLIALTSTLLDHPLTKTA
ncbi:MAG TPA: response regulator [Acidobacteriaceae bacterium]|nr:response regulator [Acidobacteriaceae bacterium]